MKFYRYYSYQNAVIDRDGEYARPSFIDPKIGCYEYLVVKETTKGYWISRSGFEYGKRWVSKTSRKKYAYPTKEQAWDNFMRRTERRIKILSYQLDFSKASLSAYNAPKFESE